MNPVDSIRTKLLTYYAPTLRDEMDKAAFAETLKVLEELRLIDELHQLTEKEIMTLFLNALAVKGLARMKMLTGDA